MGVSTKAISKSVFYRETFQSELSSRKNNCVPTSITYQPNGAYFNGTTSYFSIPNAKTNQIRLIINYKTKFHAFLATGITLTITGTTLNVAGLTTPTVYVNGVVKGNNTAGNIAAGKNEIVITTATVYKLVSPTIGKNSTNFADGSISLLELQRVVDTASGISNLYNKTAYTKLPTTIKDYTPSCFEGNNSAYIEVPDSDLLSFGDGSGITPLWACKTIYPNTVTTGGINKGNTEYSLFDITSSGFVQCRIYTSAAIYVTWTSTISLVNSISNLVFYYEGNKTNPIGHLFVNGIEVTFNRVITGSYTGMSNSATALNISTGLTGAAEKLGCKNWDIRIGSGTLTQQQVNDIYAGKRVGTERLWLPLCEDAGNVRFDVSGNGLHGILKGTQDGKYNVGRQNIFDYYRKFGGSTKGLNKIVQTHISPALMQTSSSFLSGSQWAIAIRILSTVVSGTNYILFDDTNAVGSIGVNDNYNGRFYFRNNSYYAWDGTGATTLVTTANIINGLIHSILLYSDGTRVYLILDGIDKGYVTPNNTIRNTIIVNGTGEGGTQSIEGFFYDLRTWNSNIGNTEALLYHSDTMTVTPDHKYSLIGDNPAKDLIGSIDGVVKAARPIAIPLQAGTQLPVLPQMTVTNPSALVLKRDIKEVFRLTGLQGLIQESVGNLTPTIAGNVSVKKLGKLSGIYFGGTTSDYISFGNVLNSYIKYGFIIKAWVYPNKIVDTNTLVSKGTGFSLRGVSTGIWRLGINTVGATLSSAAIGLNKQPQLIIAYVNREKQGLYVFGKNGLLSGVIQTTQYLNQDIVSALLIGKDTSTNPYKGYIFNMSIYSIGELTSEECVQLYQSEKQYYY